MAGINYTDKGMTARQVADQVMRPVAPATPNPEHIAKGLEQLKTLTAEQINSLIERTRQGGGFASDDIRVVTMATVLTQGGYEV